MNEWKIAKGIYYILTEKNSIAGVSVLVLWLPSMCQSRDWDYIRPDCCFQVIEPSFDWFKQKEIWWKDIVWGIQCSQSQWETGGPSLKRSGNQDTSRWPWQPKMQMPSKDRKVEQNGYMAWVWMRKVTAERYRICPGSAKQQDYMLSVEDKAFQDVSLSLLDSFQFWCCGPN